MIHKYKTIFGIICMFLLYVSCGMAKAGNNRMPSSSDQTPTIHEKISATAESQPEWIKYIPADDGRHHFMVGFSDYYKSEREAREAAKQDARAQYARYVGVEVSEIDEVARFLEGKENEFINGQVTRRSRQKQSSDAVVSRIRARNFYIESYSDKRRGKYVGSSYRGWVLVSIPVDEDERVAEWRRRKFQQNKSGSAINVKIRSNLGNGQTYVEGDKISYFASIDRDAYLLLIYEDAAGNLLQIYPDVHSANHLLKAGHMVQVPKENDQFKFHVSAPFGRERVLAFASSRPFPELSGNEQASGLKVLDINLDKILKYLRTAGSQPGTAYGEGLTALTTVAKDKKKTVPIKTKAAPANNMETLIWSSAPERPGWTVNEPETVNGVVSFVGVSSRYAVEKSARADARRDASATAVKYMGTVAKQKLEIAKASFGLESDVVDPTKAAKELQKEMSVNMARKVKIQKWYIEKWKTPTGTGYQVFALANVPESVVDESYKQMAAKMQRDAERKAKEASDAITKNKANKAVVFWGLLKI